MSNIWRQFVLLTARRQFEINHEGHEDHEDFS